MEPLVLIGLALGLSMDTLAIAAAEGAYLKKIHFRGVFRMAFSFGLFQGLMPVIGWAAGTSFSQYIKTYDHWVALAVLLVIGSKMIWEEVKNDKDTDKSFRSCERLATLLLMSLATSIDALAVGFTFAFLKIEILAPVLLIGGLTFLVSGLGVYIGAWIGRRFEKIIGVLGGLVLIGIGVRILLDHLLTNK